MLLFPINLNRKKLYGGNHFLSGTLITFWEIIFMHLLSSQHYWKEVFTFMMCIWSNIVHEICTKFSLKYLQNILVWSNIRDALFLIILCCLFRLSEIPMISDDVRAKLRAVQRRLLQKLCASILGDGTAQMTYSRGCVATPETPCIH